MVTENAGVRLSRMLALVPFVGRRPGVTLTDLAEEFAVPVEQIRADLDLLMVCGLPGYYPDDLIDVVLDEDGGTVSIAFDAGIERPVRLSADEVVALTVALQALAELPGLVDGAAVRSALAKLEQVGAAPAGVGDAVRVAAAEDAPALAQVRSAIESGHQLRMRYYTASRDAVTERTVDPMRVLVTDGHAYLEAFCHSAQAVRHFRIDRIDAAEVRDEPAQAPLFLDADVPETMFTRTADMPAATVLLAPAARWVAEYYPNDGVGEASPAEVLAVVTDPAIPAVGTQGWQRVRLRAGGDEWMVRLVLSLGGAAFFADRPDLAAAVADRAATALAAYDQGAAG